MYLKRVIGRCKGGLRRMPLGKRNFASVAFALVFQPGDLQYQESTCLKVQNHLRDHLLDELVSAYLFSESCSLLCIADGMFETCAYRSKRSCRYGEPAYIKRVHSDFESLSFAAGALGTIRACLEHSVSYAK